jgi:putative mRNA 3-end processing factor
MMILSGHKKDLLTFTPKGIYCAHADVYLDPTHSVERAIISHAHSDHAKNGSKHYLSSKGSAAPLRLRLGKNINLETLDYGKKVEINGVSFSFHPAGHVIGSAQIRVEYKGEVWVYTGDYKLEDDGFAEAFEVVNCHTFITESTFGLPVYRWRPQNLVFDDMNRWWEKNAERNICSIILAYSLGKAQRIIKNIDHRIGTIYTQSAITSMNSALREAGQDLPETKPFREDFIDKLLSKSLLIVPAAGNQQLWLKDVFPYAIAHASGWVGLRGSRMGAKADQGFTLSDHADWPSLNKAVKDTGASRIIVTHGFEKQYSTWLKEQGFDANEAHPVK